MEVDNRDEEFVKGGKLTPQGSAQRTNMFRNMLLGLVRQQHKQFCTTIGIDLVDENIQRFNKDFDVDACPPIACAEFPEKPHVEKFATAAEVLEKARDLFEVNPQVSAILEQVADKTLKEKEETKKVVEKVEVKVVPPVVPKALSTVPMSLLEKIRAKEREKKAKDMYQNKDEEIKMKRLRRLPDIAR